MVENKVKEYRERAGLTQTELSRRARIASPNLSDIENGKRLPWPRVKRSLARVLKVSIDELFPEGSENGV